MLAQMRPLPLHLAIKKMNAVNRCESREAEENATPLSPRSSSTFAEKAKVIVQLGATLTQLIIFVFFLPPPLPDEDAIQKYAPKRDSQKTYVQTS